MFALATRPRVGHRSQSRQWNRNRAAAAVKAAGGCTLKMAKAACEGSHDGEWHHVGKFAARVNYYSVNSALVWLETEARLGTDPLRSEIEIAEWAEMCAADRTLDHDDDVYRLCGDRTNNWYGKDVREGSGPGTVGEARIRTYRAGQTSNQNAMERANEAAAFSRWEAALRRF